MKIILEKIQNNSSTNIAIRCPHCGHNGTFVSLGINDIHTNNEGINYYLGIRKCPNHKCKGHLFFISDYSRNLIYTFPSETIPFDKENIPERVLNAFSESIICHSNSCYIASGIMIRKTLEEICLDREAKGKNLKDRIADLGTKILIPRELFDGIDDLRLLGNDAAHIENKTFSEVGKEEIEVSIEFVKEILKAVYQYESLLERLRKLKVNKNEA